jgi:ATPase involved in DNA repair
MSIGRTYGAGCRQRSSWFAGKAGCSIMLITRVELENIKSYRRIVIDLRQGTTAISGSNGAGKTTLVEAIGFALFDYLPYNRDQFVREGEKTGRVVVSLIGGDERPYVVERRCGSGARWMVNDSEADLRLEQKADVLDKLHDIFGIDRERPLDSLFRDALGVPQGTFTAIFLDSASKRKQTFDTLLQIEDYKTASDNLLETQHYYRDQLRDQKSTIDRLEFETRDLENWHTQIEEERRIDAEKQRRNSQISEQIIHHETRKQQLDEQKARLNDLTNQLHDAQSRFDFAQTTLHERLQALEKAQRAHQIVQDSRTDQARFEQASDVLRGLRQDAKQRDTLRQQRASCTNTQTQITTQLRNLQDRLGEIARARQRVIELAPLVDQQSTLEHQRDELRQQVNRYDEITAQGQKLVAQQKQLQQQLAGCQQQISVIEPLIPLAQQLEARSEHFNQLKIQLHERDEKRRQQREKQQQLQNYQQEYKTLSENLRKAERNVQIIEEHRSEAETLPELERERDSLIAQFNRLEGNIEGYERSREQSAGGQCPLLHESCLNVQRHGNGSLEAYFEGLLTTDKAQLTQTRKQQQNLEQHIKKIKPFAEALIKKTLYVEKRDELTQRLQLNINTSEQLQIELAALTQGLEQLTPLEQQLQASNQAWQESKRADQKVRELDALASRQEQLQQFSAQQEDEIQRLRDEATQLRDSRTQLQQIDTQLTTLNNPRGQSQIHQGTIARESDFQQQQLTKEGTLAEIEQELAQLDEQLARYSTLDQAIAQQELIIQQSEAGHKLYHMYINEAQTLTERQNTSQQQQQLTDTATIHLQETKNAHEQAQSAFDEQELRNLVDLIEKLKREQSGLIQQIRYQQERIEQLEHDIKEAEALRVELTNAQQEFQTLEDLQKMLDLFRKHIKEAAPHVLHAMLTDISAEANRIFGEIMGDRSAQLSWHNDYEITLRRQGVDRSFAQLSGGEQMSAALAVRLALLKKLSTLNVAFFDEPTQNMDELRRMNLAEQIRRVRGFDQLLVISHDDTFEQGLDSLIRLNKTRGETLVVSEDGILPAAELGEAWQSVIQNDPSLLQTTN